MQRAGDPLSDSVEPGGCYGVQVLIAGRQKQWRDEISAQVRREGFSATTVDSGIDALTILVLGLPVDVLLTDVDLHGDLGFSQLAAEARALRPNLSIVLTSARAEDEAELVPDAFLLQPRERDVASALREVLAVRAA